MSTYLEISRIMTLIGSLAITCGLYLQAAKIFKTKSAKDFTWVILAALLLSELVWLNYGYCLKEWPIIATSIADIPATTLAGIGFMKYGRNTKSDNLKEGK